VALGLGLFIKRWRGIDRALGLAVLSFCFCAFVCVQRLSFVLICNYLVHFVVCFVHRDIIEECTHVVLVTS
jgi:hypothetical protein